MYTPKISANLTVSLLEFSAQNLHKCPGGDTGFNQPDGDGSSGDKPAGTGRIDENGVVHITTREVPDIRVERDKTINWYKGNLQGKTVTHPELGEILFTDKGIDHTAGPRSRAGMEKLMLVRYLKHLIANGKTDGWGDLKHDDRKDDYVQFAIIKNNVLINGTEKEVGCFVGKKADGKTYYDLYIGQNKTVDGLPQFRARSNNGLDTENINQDVPVVNLFIED